MCDVDSESVGLLVECCSLLPTLKHTLVYIYIESRVDDVYLCEKLDSFELIACFWNLKELPRKCPLQQASTLSSDHDCG